MRLILRVFGQPSVVAEMLAGLVVGPSVAGTLVPGATLALFAPSSLDALNALSQIGLVLFMFTVGVRVRAHAVHTGRRTAALTSAASIAAPFAMGVALSFVLRPRVAPAAAPWPFALFIGTAMSITAFPVLARILAEHKLFDTRLGRLAIACAAFDDVTGWLLLSVALSLTRADSPALVATRIGLLVLYIAVMAGIVRPLLEWVAARDSSPHALDEEIAAVLMVLLLSAAATDAIGVHALFGAFLSGIVMPKHSAVDDAIAALEPVTMTFLLPLFFAFTGLRTDVRLIHGAALLATTGVIVAVAIVGKLGAAAVAARVGGLGWREAFAFGALVNTRGLVELVVLNIGLDAGILSPLVFSMLVAMALITTFMTSPLLSLLLS
jgi:Kef-type K+ transport system membrane component KefB